MRVVRVLWGWMMVSGLACMVSGVHKTAVGQTFIGQIALAIFLLLVSWLIS